MAGQQGRHDPKEAALAAARCLNPHPEQVTDPEFGASDFFDARDAVQVKYETVRKVRAGRAGPRPARAARRQQAPRGDPRLGRGAAGRRPRAAPVSSGPRKIYRLRLADTTGDQLAQHRVQPAHGRAAAVAAAGTSLTGLYVVVVVAAEAAAQASSRSACTARARTRSSPSGSSAALIATAVCAALCGSTPIITAAMETLLPFRRARTVAGTPNSRTFVALTPLLSHATARPRQAGTSFESQPSRAAGG